MSRPLTQWHTLGWASYILPVKFLDIDSEEVVSLFEVDLQIPRNPSVHESEECEDGEGVGVYSTLLPIVSEREEREDGGVWMWYLLWLSDKGRAK